MTDVNWRTHAGNEADDETSGDALLERALMLKNIRAFFDARSVIEVETPLLSHYSTTDPHLDTLQSRFRDQRCFLNTSPEYAMKRLLASWQHPVFQICKAFRDDELGPNHNPEFTLLEWYRPGFDMSQLMDEVIELVSELCHSSRCFSLHSSSAKQLTFKRLSYQQAFQDSLGIDPHQVSSTQCYQLAESENIEIPQGLTADDEVDEWLDWLLTQRVLPAFSRRGFTLLYDYPASQCSLARVEVNVLPNGQSLSVAKRFELFFGEVELANGFYELTDADEQLQRFYRENQARGLAGKTAGRIDQNFIAALQQGLPDCSGVAMGLDRLLMVLLNAEHIDQVLSFSWSDS